MQTHAEEHVMHTLLQMASLQAAQQHQDDDPYLEPTFLRACKSVHILNIYTALIIVKMAQNGLEQIDTFKSIDLRLKYHLCLKSCLHRTGTELA